MLLHLEKQPDILAISLQNYRKRNSSAKHHTCKRLFSASKVDMRLFNSSSLALFDLIFPDMVGVDVTILLPAFDFEGPKE